MPFSQTPGAFCSWVLRNSQAKLLSDITVWKGTQASAPQRALKQDQASVVLVLLVLWGWRYFTAGATIHDSSTGGGEQEGLEHGLIVSGEKSLYRHSLLARASWCLSVCLSQCLSVCLSASVPGAMALQAWKPDLGFNTFRMVRTPLFLSPHFFCPDAPQSQRQQPCGDSISLTSWTPYQ